LLHQVTSLVGTQVEEHFASRGQSLRPELYEWQAIPSLAVGVCCEIEGLVSTPEYNGKRCTLTSFQGGRWGVRLVDSAHSGKMLSVKAANLSVKAANLASVDARIRAMPTETVAAGGARAEENTKEEKSDGGASSRKLGKSWISNPADGNPSAGPNVCCVCGKGPQGGKKLKDCPRCRGVLYCRSQPPAFRSGPHLPWAMLSLPSFEIDLWGHFQTKIERAKIVIQSASQG